MQLMVYAVACPLLHGFCALGELGKVSPTHNPATVDQSTTVIWHDKANKNVCIAHQSPNSIEA